MADSMDLVQQRVQEELARNLASAIHRPAGASEFFVCLLMQQYRKHGAAHCRVSSCALPAKKSAN